jgi:hypothetical protein
MKRRHLLALAPALLAACAAPDVSDYAREQPPLDLRTYFNGRVDGYGIFTDRNGKVVRRFTVVVDGQWHGDDGVLDEHFTYSDGTTQRRVWRLRALGGDRFAGQADDVVGEAMGQASGNSLHWNYTLALPVDGSTWHVQMDDWMHLVDGEVLLNRTAMRKFGIHLGDVTLSFRRQR